MYDPLLSIFQDNHRKALGKRIRQIRKEKNISQKELASGCFLSREQIYRVELGKKNITLNSLIGIAGVLKVHLKELFDYDVR